MPDNSEPIKIAIIEGCSSYRKALSDRMKAEQDMIVVGEAADGGEGIRLIQEKRPDVVLLDLLMPRKDGIAVLEELSDTIIKNTIIIAISEIEDEKLILQVISLGAKYYVVKPVNENVIIRRIRQLYGVYTAKGNPKRVKTAVIREKEKADEIMCYEEVDLSYYEKVISLILGKIGISPNIKGYRYLKKAITMTVKDENALVGITKCMYPEIGKLYNTTSSKVERAMRHAIDSAWKKEANRTYFEMVGLSAKGKPTNTKFIAAVSEYIRLNCDYVKYA